MILVVVVIAALLAIAAPFVASMRLAERSARGFSAQVRARHLADAARNRAVAHLMETHPDEERRAREARNDRVSDDEGHDSQDELTPPVTPVVGLASMETSSATGDMAEVEVTDARARIDLNASGPDPIANLLGATITTAVLDYDETDALYVEDTRPFFTDGDPTTIDGFVRVNHEYIAYRDISLMPPARGSDEPQHALRGLVRGFLFSRDPPPEEADARKAYHGRGSLVQDGRGYKIAFDALWRNVDTDRQGQLARFDGPAGVRRIADWEFARLRAAMVLERYGVTLERCRRWGVTKDALDAAGLDSSRMDEEARRKDETPDEKKEREKAEDELARWGIPVSKLRDFGGDQAVLRAWRALAALDPATRDKTVAALKERQEQVEAQARKLDDWLKDEMKRQVKDLTEARDQAPHLETIGRVELEEKIRPFTTTDAPPLAEAWSDPQPVNHRLAYMPNEWAGKLRVQDTRRFAMGMLLRFQPRDGTAPEYRYCVGARRDAVVLYFPQLDRTYEASTVDVSCRLPAPINVNTASREVLAAVLTGLQSRNHQTQAAMSAPDMVTPAEARAISDAIVETPPGDHLALRGLLLGLSASGAISAHDVDAVFRNAIDPGDGLLTRSTVPFCYASGDAYELVATGIVNDAAGNEVAHHRYREAVRVAPPRDLVWTIDSQQDMTDRVWIDGPLAQGVRPDPRDGGVASIFLPGCATNLIQTRPAYLGPYGARPFVAPSRSHAPGEGDMTPLLSHEAEIKDKGSYTPLSVTPGVLGAPQTWDDQLDGVPLAQPRLPAGQVGGRFFLAEDGDPRLCLGPGMVRFWLRIDALPGGRAYVLDGGKARGVDRVSLYFEGGELVLEVDDPALDEREALALGLPGPRTSQLRYKPPATGKPFQVGNWYHIAACWKGSDRGDLALFVDGRAVGQETHGSRLVDALDPFSGQITVEDARDFPPQGLLRIGQSRWGDGSQNDRGIGNTGRDANDRCEVLYYRQRSGNTLIVDTPPINVIANIIAAGGQLAGPVQPDPGAIPTAGRQPRRGSGQVYTISYTLPGRPGTQQTTITQGRAHAAGTLVVPYGYHSDLKVEAAANMPPGGAVAYQEVLRRGQATLAQPLPHCTPVTLLYQPMPAYTVTDYTSQGGPIPVGRFDLFPQVVDANATVLPALWAGVYPAPPPAALPPPRPQLPAGQVPRATPPGGVEAVPNVIGGWPPMGIVRVSSNKPTATGVVTAVERILYTGIDPATGRLLGCVRGVEGTTAAPHYLFDTVALESIVVSDPRDYAQRAAIDEGRVFLSLTQGRGTPQELTEWLSIQTPSDARSRSQNLLIIPTTDSLTPGPGSLPPFPYLQDLISQMLNQGGNLGGNPGLLPISDPLAYDYGQPVSEVLKRWEVNGSRAAKGTTKPAGPGHATGTRVVPTFAVDEDDRDESGKDDIVTVCDDGGGAPTREEARIAHAARCDRQTNAQQRAQGNVGDATDGWLIAFDDFVAREYRGDQHARLDRYPVGNLHSIPDLTFGAVAALPGGGTAAGAPQGVGLQGRIDDLVSMQLDDPGRVLFAGALDASGTEVGPVQGRPNQLRSGGLWHSDGEVIAVVDAQGAGQDRNRSQLTLLRGALGSTAQPQSGETHAWGIDWPPMAICEAPVGGNRGQALPIRDVQGPFRKNDGYVAIDRGLSRPWAGVLPFDEWKRDHLGRPVDALDRGAFDHAFGSDRAIPVAGDLLIDLPFRPHDRYADRLSSIEGVFFQAARELPGSFVTKVDWDEQLPTAFCEVKVAVRLDGAPGWDAEPAKEPGLTGQLYVFDDPKELNELMLRADRVELRVYLTFKPNALTNDAWKRAATVGAVRVHYRQPTQTIRHEERTD